MNNIPGRRMQGERAPAFTSTDQADKTQKQFEVAKIISRNDMFLRGMISVEELDDEELRLGRARNNNGLFENNSKKTSLLPPTLRELVDQEHSRRMSERLRQIQDRALETMVGIMDDRTAEPADRFKASQYLFERVNGKTSEKLAVTIQKAPWEEVFEGIGQLSREQSRMLRANATGANPNQPPLTIDGEVEEVTVRPYGFIQAPTENSEHLDDPVLHASGEWDDAQLTEAELAQKQATYPQTAHQEDRQPTQHEPSAAILDETTVKVIEYEQTVPPDHIEPPYGVPPNMQKPTHNNPINTSATAPSGRYVPQQAQEQYADPSEPLSGQLRDRMAAASELAAERKANREARDTAKKLRQDASPERGRAKVGRIIRRNMGLDANKPIDILADVQPMADGEERVRWSIG